MQQLKGKESEDLAKEVVTGELRSLTAEEVAAVAGGPAFINM
jgi:hypothetical protein